EARQGDTALTSHGSNIDSAPYRRLGNQRAFEPALAIRTVMPNSDTPACRQAPRAFATFWNGQLASPWITTVGSVSGVPAAASGDVSPSAVTLAPSSSK